MRLSIGPRKGFVATKPFGVSDNLIENFISKKANWVLSKLEVCKLFNNKDKTAKKLGGGYLRNKSKAIMFIKDRIEELNKNYGFDFNRINIKNQKTRWGSCSKKRNLNFNYKIIFLSKKVADYIIIHEMCHLKEFNHSQKFWDLVSKVFPDYKEIRAELKRNNTNF